MYTNVPQFISRTALAAAVVIAGYAGFTYQESSSTTASTFDGKKVSEAYTTLARENIIERFNPKKAKDFYEKAVIADSTNTQALYELSRAHMVLGDFPAALNAAERFASAEPADSKILYVQGLASGFAGDYTASAAFFKRYIETNQASKWQSRLDLAWAQYQLGDYASAKETIDAAIVQFGSNAWLSTSRGAVEHALGNTDVAREALGEASKQIAEVDHNTWTTNYSFNGPDSFEKGVEQMKRIISINESLINGESPTFTKDSFSKMAGFAPEAGKGIVVSACGETCGPQVCQSAANSCGATQSWNINTCNGQSCATNPLPPPAVPDRYGLACTSINTCGIQATGTVGCDGRCSAVAPLPNAFGQGCTVRNRCGSATGTVGCNGQCNVARYPTCTNPNDPDVTGGDDGWTEVIINDDDRFRGQNFGNIGVKIALSPSLVRPGQRTVVRWNSVEMSSCTVTGTNGDSWTGVQGEEVTRPITLRVTYTIRCTAFDGRELTDTAVVGVAPIVCEIGQAGCPAQ